VDFTFDEAQQAVADLADQILDDRLDTDRLLAIEDAVGADGAWFDADLWGSLAAAGLLGIALDEGVGGGGLDAVALAILLRAQGSHVAPLPLLPHCVASLAVDRFGSEEQRIRLTRPVPQHRAQPAVQRFLVRHIPVLHRPFQPMAIGEGPHRVGGRQQLHQGQKRVGL